MGKKNALATRRVHIILFITSDNTVMQSSYALMQAFNSNFILKTSAKSAEILANQNSAAFGEAFSFLYDCS